MNTLELKVDQKIGMLYYESRKEGKASIEEIAKISQTGVVTLKNGVCYTPKGKEIGALGDPTYLCSVERAQEFINKALTRQQKKEEKRGGAFASLEGKRNTAVIAVVRAAIQTLNQHGWFADVDGHLDVIESEIESLISKYVNEHDPVD